MVEFSETPLMSTYLVAFVVGHLEFVEGATGTPTHWARPAPVIRAMERKPRLHTFFPSCSLGAAEGVAVRVYTPLGKKEGGQFALDVASTHPPPPVAILS